MTLRVPGSANSSAVRVRVTPEKARLPPSDGTAGSGGGLVGAGGDNRCSGDGITSILASNVSIRFRPMLDKGSDARHRQQEPGPPRGQASSCVRWTRFKAAFFF